MDLVFIDLKKAFDTVDHVIQSKKRELYGVQQRELSWFKSYLTNRKWLCRVNAVDSKIGDIEVGVPQGSCLGPLLLLIYINDLPLAFPNSIVSMFADDTSLRHQADILTQLTEAINNDFRQLDTWLQGNRLSLNVTKTLVMLGCTKKRHSILKSRNENLSLNIRGFDLEVVPTTNI